MYNLTLTRTRPSFSFSAFELSKFGLPLSFTYEFGTFSHESMRFYITRFIL